MVLSDVKALRKMLGKPPGVVAPVTDGGRGGALEEAEVSEQAEVVLP